MKDFFENWFGALLLAWKKLMDFPLPGKIQKYVPGEDSAAYELAAFPLLGWLAGMLLCCCAMIVAWIFNRYTGAFVFALMAWLLMTLRDSGRGDGAVASVVASWLPGDAVPWRIVIPVAAEILKFALLMLLFYRGCGWAVAVVLGGAFAVEVILVLTADFEPPVLEDTPEARHILWLTLGVLGGISFIISQLSTVVAVLIFIVVWRQFSRRAEEHSMTLGQISFAGSVMSWVLLISMSAVI